jgi:hypothetical protein
LEASHAKRSGGDTLSRDELSGQPVNHSVQDASEALPAPAEKEIVLFKKGILLYRESSTRFTGILVDSLLIFDAGLAIGNVLRWKRNIFNCVRIRRIGREVKLHSAAGQCYM